MVVPMAMVLTLHAIFPLSYRSWHLSCVELRLNQETDLVGVLNLVIHNLS